MRRLADILISDRLVFTVIVVNTIALGLVESYPRGSGGAAFWYWVDYACVAFFVLEATLKIGRWSWRGYWASRWNRFDFVLVALSTPMLFTPIAGGLGLFGHVMVLRVGRLFRLFRALRFIPNIDHLAIGIRRALKASIGVFLALLLVNFVLAMAATMLFGEIDQEAFGTPLRSSYTLFKVFTVEGWYEVPDEAAHRVAQGGADVNGVALDPMKVKIWLRLFFVVSVLVGGILGLSLANAVFVDQMMMDNTDALEAKVEALTAEIRELRNELGRNRPGTD